MEPVHIVMGDESQNEAFFTEFMTETIMRLDVGTGAMTSHIAVTGGGPRGIVRWFDDITEQSVHHHELMFLPLLH